MLRSAGRPTIDWLGLPFPGQHASQEQCPTNYDLSESSINRGSFVYYGKVTDVFVMPKAVWWGPGSACIPLFESLMVQIKSVAGSVEDPSQVYQHQVGLQSLLTPYREGIIHGIRTTDRTDWAEDMAFGGVCHTSARTGFEPLEPILSWVNSVASVYNTSVPTERWTQETPQRLKAT